MAKGGEVTGTKKFLTMAATTRNLGRQREFGSTDGASFLATLDGGVSFLAILSHDRINILFQYIPYHTSIAARMPTEVLCLCATVMGSVTYTITRPLI